MIPCDIRQFFPAIDHVVLKNMLRRTLACKRTFALCESIIDSGAGVLDAEYRMQYFTGDDLFAAARHRGLPIGNLTSQFWANVYLNELDQFVKHHLRAAAYVRYVDDFLLFADSKLELHRMRDAISRFLEQLRLTLHAARAQPVPTRTGIPFLGFVVYPDHRRLKRRKVVRFRRHLMGIYHAYRRGELPRLRLDASVQAWVGHAQHGDTWNLRAAVFQPIAL